MARLETFDDITYDPFHSDSANFGTEADPYPLIHALRAKGPVHHGGYRSHFGLADGLPPGTQAFTVVGTDAITEVLTDQTRFSNKAYVANLGTSFGRGSISTMDNPEHGRFRRIFQRIFLPQHVKLWGESIVAPVVRELMDRFTERGNADLVQDFTIRYPFEIIYRQLNLPPEDVLAFQKMAIAQTDFFSPGKAVEAGEKLGRYFEALIAERRAAPGDDLVSLLASTEVDGEYLPPVVLLSFLRQLMNAAGDTTYRGTSILFAALLENPDQFEAVRDRRELISAAIEEALRFDGPVLAQTRLALADTELCGFAIPEGAILDVVAGAANRDPAIWEDPDRFNIFRKRDPHWAFSRGPHICLGQHLARVEMTRAVEAVLDLLPNLRLDADMPPPDVRGIMMRAPEHLFVRFGD